jgi:hypothetical protein
MKIDELDKIKAILKDYIAIQDQGYFTPDIKNWCHLECSKHSFSDPNMIYKIVCKNYNPDHEAYIEILLKKSDEDIEKDLNELVN